ncbi:MAG: alpha,2-mannosyltransferase [Verrucomicrobiota bacterium]|jgi:alpha-1,2-mannosyltransferase
MKLTSSQGATARRLLSITLIVLVLAAAAIPTFVRNATTEKDTQDFAPIYHAAQAMWTGQNIYSATNGLYIYPPFLAFIFQPFVLFPEHTAAIVWVIASAFFIALAALMAAREMTRRWIGPPDTTDRSLSWIIAAVAILLSADKIHADFRLGQTDCLMILGFACVLRWMDRKPWMAGLAVGATANMKYLTLIFVPYFLLKRNFRAATASIVSFTLLMVIPALEVGVREATRFAASAFGALIKMADLGPHLGGHGMKIPRASWERSVSVTSAILRFTRSHQYPDWLAFLFILAALGIVAAAIIFVSRYHGVRLFAADVYPASPAREAATSLEWAALIVLALTFSPQTTARHMVLLLLVYVVTLGVLLAQKGRRGRVVLTIAMIITSLGLSFPPRKMGIDEALWAWRGVAGASLCAIFLLLVILYYGSRTIRDWTGFNSQETLQRRY